MKKVFRYRLDKETNVIPGVRGGGRNGVCEHRVKENGRPTMKGHAQKGELKKHLNQLLIIGKMCELHTNTPHERTQTHTHIYTHLCGRIGSSYPGVVLLGPWTVVILRQLTPNRAITRKRIHKRQHDTKRSSLSLFPDYALSAHHHLVAM